MRFPGRAAFYCLIPCTAIMRLTSSATAGSIALTSKSVRFREAFASAPVSATALLVVEGDTEEAFCKYLKQLFNRDCGLRVTIHNARGRSPDQIVEEARAKCCQAHFDRVHILMDDDYPILLKKSHAAIRVLKITLWRSKPCCIEGFFLTLMGHPPPGGSSLCKSVFHKVGLSAHDKLDPYRYETIFPASQLGILRLQHPLLDEIIRFLSNK